MHVALLHNRVDAAASGADRDVLVQAQAVGDACRDLHHRTTLVPCSLNLERLRDELGELAPEIVFNLVESLGGTDRLIHLVPSLLDVLNLPYTGAPAAALWYTTNKVLAKQELQRSGLPTPNWATHDAGELHCPAGHFVAGPFLVKTVFEHASFGLDDDSLVEATTAADLLVRLRDQERRWGRPCFAEQYVEGREFNLSLLAGTHGPLVLPPAEIEFLGFAAGKPRIVGYRAKWDESSPEYHDTPRRFTFTAEDGPLIDHLRELAARCWHVFGLRGYARVDFRVDPQGQPWILEVNANPCLSPDAGFAAALPRAGIPFTAAVQAILDDVPRPWVAPQPARRT